MGLAALAQPPKPEPAAGTEVTIDGLKSVAPAAWKAEKPANRLRSYQFKLPHANGDKEDAELYVSPDIQGAVAENFARWKELVLPTPDRPKADTIREGKLTVGKATLHTLDLQGTYLVKHIPIDKTAKEAKPDYRVIAVLWESKDGRHAIRLIGPQHTVAAHQAKFEEWLKNFK